MFDFADNSNFCVISTKMQEYLLRYPKAGSSPTIGGLRV